MECFGSHFTVKCETLKSTGRSVLQIPHKYAIIQTSVLELLPEL